MRRLSPQPGERIDRESSIAFTFDGAPVSAYEGDTIASALLASGRHVLSRSFKYHRPRGELCGCGQCANSLMQVDGAPGVRACATPVLAGMRVEHQNAWPSLDLDLMSAAGKLASPFMPVGFYYKTFIRPRRLWPVYEKALRHAAGLGRLPKRQQERRWRTEYRRRHCDVLVIGGGIAGLCAALRAAQLGADVVLCDEDLEPGGAQLAEGGSERMRELAAQAQAAGVEILSRGCALGCFDGLVPVWQGDVLHQVRARQHVAATGAIEQPLIFPENDLPGIMLAGGARRLAALYALAPGTAAVLACVGDAGLEAALALHAAGVRIEAVADLRPDAHELPTGTRVVEAGIALLSGASVVHAVGRRGVKRVTLARIGRDGAAVPGSEQELECDLLAVSGGFVPASSLLLQAGARASYDETAGRFLAQELPPGVHAAGAVAGHEDRDAAELSGALAGAKAAHALGIGSESLRQELAEQGARLQALPLARISSPPACASGRRGGKAFVDLDEDVTVKDVEHAALEGFDSIELSKRYTTVTMGPCAGPLLPAAGCARLLAAQTGATARRGRSDDGAPAVDARCRSGSLAGRPFEPAQALADPRPPPRARRQRPAGRATGDAPMTTATLRARRWRCTSRAGLIDVSTLGKLLVRGPDAGELLDRLYPNRVSDLKPGRIRYGVLLSDAGRIIDDGTICRLDDETFYVTTTSSGAGAVEQWFSWWLAAWGLGRARCVDVTQGLAAVNLAGPRAARCSRRSPSSTARAEAFRYLDGRQAQVAGVQCLLLRIGFVGELGYEIHCPAAHGEHALGRAACRPARSRRAPVRPRAAAHPAPAEAAHHRRAGHRLRVRPPTRPACRGPSSSTRSSSSSAAGRSSTPPSTTRSSGSSASWSPTARCRPRAPWSSTATPPAGR